MFNLIPWTGRGDRQLDQLFEGFFGERTPVTAGWMPSIDLAETEEEITVQAEIPGMDAKDFEITVKDGVLTLSGEKKDTREEEKDGYVHIERSFGSFHREVYLSSAVDEEKITADYDNGVVTIRLPKVQPDVPKKIEVTSK